MRTLIWLALLAAVSGAFSGRYVSMEIQRDVMSDLTTLSTVVFGVMGAWIAIIFPNVLKVLYSPSFEGIADEQKVVRRLMAPLVVSAFVLTALTLLKLAAAVGPIVAGTSPGAELWCRAISFAVIAASAFSLIFALLYTLVPALGYYVDLRDKVQDQHEQAMRQPVPHVKS